MTDLLARTNAILRERHGQEMVRLSDGQYLVRESVHGLPWCRNCLAFTVEEDEIEAFLPELETGDRAVLRCESFDPFSLTTLDELLEGLDGDGPHVTRRVQ